MRIQTSDLNNHAGMRYRARRLMQPLTSHSVETDFATPRNHHVVLRRRRTGTHQQPEKTNSSRTENPGNHKPQPGLRKIRDFCEGHPNFRCVCPLGSHGENASLGLCTKQTSYGKSGVNLADRVGGIRPIFHMCTTQLYLNVLDTRTT